MSVTEAPPKPALERVQGNQPTLWTEHTPAHEVLWVRDLPTSPPSAWRVSRIRPPRRKWKAAVSTVFLVLLLIAAATFTVARPLRSSSPVGAVNSPQPAGSLISASTHGSNELQIRTTEGHVIPISVAGKKLVTADGFSLALSSFRPGDTLTASPGAALVNRSQSRVSLQGIVAISPDPDGNVMTVQLASARTVIVDIDAGTRVDGRLPSVHSRMSIQQADQVRIVGILDTTLGEMTQTLAVTHLASPGSASLQ